MMASSTSSLARNVLRLTRSNVNFHRVRDKVEVISGSPGNLQCKLLIGEDHCNCHGTLHGGMMATLIDDIGGTANVTALKDGQPDIPALTVHSNISYLNVALPGQYVTINADILKKGSTFAYASVSIVNESGQLVALGNNILHLGKPRNGMSHAMFQEK